MKNGFKMKNKENEKGEPNDQSSVRLVQTACRLVLYALSSACVTERRVVRTSQTTCRLVGEETACRSLERKLSFACELGRLRACLWCERLVVRQVSFCLLLCDERPVVWSNFKTHQQPSSFFSSSFSSISS